MGGAILVRGGRLFDPGAGIDRVGDLLVVDGLVAAVGDAGRVPAGTRVLEAGGALVTPSFTDLHVHLREPGGEASERIATGTASALAGGFSTVFAMPNTDPVADRPEVIARVLAAAKAAGPCRVVPVSAISIGLAGRELVDFEAQASAGAGAFSDDGAWLEDDAIADVAFSRAARGGWLVMEHCEDFRITRTGVLHDAPVVRAAGIPGIPRASEDEATARDVALAERHGTRLHLCHVSTAGAVDLLRSAKSRGIAVTGEATPHHLTLTVEDALTGGADFKMKPPLRERSDVDVLVRALEDGTIDAVATDHAPHAPSKKGGGLGRSPFGAIGLETAFPVLYTRLVLSGRVSLGRLVLALTAGPARVAGRDPASLRIGNRAEAVVIDLQQERAVDRARLASKSTNCPFHGMRLRGWPRAVLIGESLASRP